ncbi:MAG: hypothetical protein WCF95_01145 [bacterium]
MIVSFNPTISNKKNHPPKMVNNNVAFKRNFDSKEIEGLTKDKANVLNNVLVFIRTGVIRAQDGAKDTLQKLMQNNPDNGNLQIIYSKFP